MILREVIETIRRDVRRIREMLDDYFRYRLAQPSLTRPKVFVLRHWHAYKTTSIEIVWTPEGLDVSKDGAPMAFPKQSLVVLEHAEHVWRTDGTKAPL